MCTEIHFIGEGSVVFVSALIIIIIIMVSGVGFGSFQPVLIDPKKELGCIHFMWEGECSKEFKELRLCILAFEVWPPFVSLWKGCLFLLCIFYIFSFSMVVGRSLLPISDLRSENIIQVKGKLKLRMHNQFADLFSWHSLLFFCQRYIE